ncbi:MAG: putative lipoprotein [Labilithrix sp.]|nr:putative lipoprotein [Labilithrix sp.]
MNWHVAKRMGVVLAVALLAACTDDGGESTPDGGGGGGTTKSAGPGLGTSKASPEGTTFTLPAGLTLVSPTKTYAVEDPVECDDKYKDEAKGNGDAVSLCLIFNNTSGGPITLTLPPGLLFVSKDGDVQNGLLPQRVTIEVPAGPRYFVPLFLYCSNEDRGTGGVGNDFALGPVVQYPAFQELYSLLEGKTLTRQDSVPIQSAITHLTNGEGLSASDRAALKAL